ncbi:hypothetical protein [uncultured Nostoc sp.]|uniref:hypothetical protein n=1 Tax=uncultured Nostoc sp. TaxID=340711 RepID=UPI0035CC5F59
MALTQAIKAVENTREIRCEQGKQDKSSYYKLVVYIWSSGRTDVVGHISVGFINSSGIQTELIGFSPETLPSGAKEELWLLWNGTKGKVYSADDEHDADRGLYKKEYPITISGYKNAMKIIVQDMHNPPRYGWFSDHHTCASWAVKIGKAAGVDVDGNGINSWFRGNLPILYDGAKLSPEERKTFDERWTRG